jgi:hypothetical protein
MELPVSSTFVPAVGVEDHVTAYGWKALAGSVIGYAMDGFDMLILGFMLAALTAAGLMSRLGPYRVWEEAEAPVAATGVAGA